MTDTRADAILSPSSSRGERGESGEGEEHARGAPPTCGRGLSAKLSRARAARNAESHDFSLLDFSWITVCSLRLALSVCACSDILSELMNVSPFTAASVVVSFCTNLHKFRKRIIYVATVDLHCDL